MSSALLEQPDANFRAAKANPAVVWISLLVVLCAAAVSIRDAIRYPGVDLRSKVVGARLMMAHRDAYNPPVPEPDEYYRMFSDNTYSPVLLSFYAPLSHLPYRAQRFVYFGFDWACVGYIFVRTRSWCSPAWRQIHCALFCLFVVADFGLRLHMERGQYYLAIAALMVTAISAWRHSDGRGWIGSIALSILVLIRPTFLILLPVLWTQGFRQEVKRTLLIAAAMVALVVGTFGLQPWLGYAHTVLHLQQQSVSMIFVPEKSPSISPAAKADATQYGKTEGMDFTRSISTHYFVERSLSALASQQFVRPVAARIFKTPKIFSRVNQSLLFSAVVYCLFLAYLLRDSAPDLKLGFAFLTPMIIESFGPQRHAYCDVTLAPILLLIVAILVRQTAIDRSTRIGYTTVIWVCLLSAGGVLVLSPSGILIAIVSLGRWLTLFLITNLFFIRRAIQKHEPISNVANRAPQELAF